MSAQTDHIETHCGPIFQYSPAEDHIDHGTVRERMCLCMYATDPRKPRLERDIRFGSFFCLGPLCPAPAMVRGQFGFLLCLRSLLALSFSGRQATGTPTPFPSLRLRREFLSLSVGCRSCARLWLFSGATPQPAYFGRCRSPMFLLPAPVLRSPGFFFTFVVARPAQHLTAAFGCELRTSSSGRRSRSPSLQILAPPRDQDCRALLLGFSSCFGGWFCLACCLSQPFLLHLPDTMDASPAPDRAPAAAPAPSPTSAANIETDTDDAPMAPAEADTSGSPYLTPEEERTLAPNPRPRPPPPGRTLCPSWTTRIRPSALRSVVCQLQILSVFLLAATLPSLPALAGTMAALCRRSRRSPRRALRRSASAARRQRRSRRQGPANPAEPPVAEAKAKQKACPLLHPKANEPPPVPVRNPLADVPQVLQPDGSNSRALRIRFCFPVRSSSLQPEVNRTGLPFSANGQKECGAVPLLLPSRFGFRQRSVRNEH